MPYNVISISLGLNFLNMFQDYLHIVTCSGVTSQFKKTYMYTDGIYPHRSIIIDQYDFERPDL